jgi:nicotinamide phosphoribosyltransferase
MKQSILLNVDAYKVSMHLMMPPNTTGVYSYIESRGGLYDKTVFFGLQAFIKEYLLEPILLEDIDVADEFYKTSGQFFNRKGWEYILDKHAGHLPVRIKAVAEGTVVPVNNVLVTIENTDPECFWLTTWLETALLRAIWYPTTVATQGFHIKEIIKEYLEWSADNTNILPYSLHDFGCRGVSSNESAMIGGMTHLVNFKGTDTIAGVVAAKYYYNTSNAGVSVIANEHSTIVSWGKEHEVDAYKNMIHKFAMPGATFSIVSDSYDIYNACENIYGDELKHEIERSGATLVVRPDSGDPIVVVGKIIKILDEKFGSTINSKGFKVLNSVRILQGDGIDLHEISAILADVTSNGYSSDNIFFGMGGQNLQKMDRDTLKFALKCSSVCVDGKWKPVQKDPITDSGKRSKPGRVTLYKTNGVFHSGVEDWEKSELHTVFENGFLTHEVTLDQVRQNTQLW